jgi:hypothetical protein
MEPFGDIIALSQGPAILGRVDLDVTIIHIGARFLAARLGFFIARQGHLPRQCAR